MKFLAALICLVTATFAHAEVARSCTQVGSSSACTKQTTDPQMPAGSYKIGSYVTVGGSSGQPKLPRLLPGARWAFIGADQEKGGDVYRMDKTDYLPGEHFTVAYELVEPGWLTEEYVASLSYEELIVAMRENVKQTRTVLAERLPLLNPRLEWVKLKQTSTHITYAAQKAED